ncbi:MAG: MerR family transcriptional regulator [Chitinophagaceae bacterium]|nr:MerR family transcriptional regulator [Chitinophagaceae bacterium]
MADPSLLSLVAAVGSDALLGLEELLALAGERLGEEITPRTVRLYATEGLIDRPGKEGRRAVYGQRHLLQLLLIRSLARRGLSLTAIAPLAACSDAELLEQLRHLEELVAPASTGAPPEPSSSEQQEALAYLQSIQRERSAPSARDRPPSLLPLLGSPPSSSSPSPSPRRSLSPRSAGRSSSSSSRWFRFSLAPGVEVHLSESASIPPAGSRREAWLQRLLDRLREQLDSES